MVFQNSLDAVVPYRTAEKIVSEPLRNFFHFSKKECVKENVKVKDDKTVHEMDVSDDSHGFTVSDYTDHGYHSFSFYSSDIDFVSEMMKLFR